MLSIGALAFLNPWLLAALVALPALWFLLRATPPSPKRLRFPGVRLLLGLFDSERTPVRTPWWLILLRCLIAGAAIFAFAEPVLNPKARLSGDGPLLLLMDGGWASANDWEARRGRALELLAEAERADRPVAFASLAQPRAAETAIALRPAADWRGEVEALRPAPWAPLRASFAARLEAAADLEIAQTVWITDGLAHEEEGERDALSAALADRGRVSLIEADGLATAIRAPQLVDGAFGATVLRARADAPAEIAVSALGEDETGGARRFGVATAMFEAGETEARAEFDLPLELRNRVARVAIEGVESAGAVALADDSVRRRRAGLVSGGSAEAGQRLVSDLHYLRAGLEGRAETVEGSIERVLDAAPDVVFLADVGRFTEAEAAALSAWVDEGGLLVRFAGSRLAGSIGGVGAAGGAASDALLPVDLRAGGRAVGGAMAWGAPQTIRPFADETPFAGLETPDEVAVNRQLLAELGPDLPARTWAALEDGTPLVTAAEQGAGRIVLFHVTANAEWSSLPLSGLFVEMIDRLLRISAGAGGAAAMERDQLEGRTARPVSVMDGYGRLADAGAAVGIEAERLAGRPGPEAPPGVYEVGEALMAFNLHGRDAALAPMAEPPAGASRETLGGAEETPLAPWLLGLALLLLIADTAAALALSGRLPRMRRAGSTAAIAAFALAAALGTGEARAQDGADADARMIAALETTFAHVLTGDPRVDRLAGAGLTGLGRVLAARTAVEPGPPVGVDLETDELAFYSLLYWPVTPDQPTPSDVATAKLNAYMRSGGMIVFDTRDRHIDLGAGSTPNARALRRLARNLDMPPLEPAADDHVLTRTFYLLETFPGRWSGGRVWVEAAPDDEEVDTSEPAPFRNRNDGVSPVVVGAVDWAGAWAIGEDGGFLAPIAGGDGWRQREMAYRFGVNLAMYALTGNYKSDQVHVPALLERLGQ